MRSSESLPLAYFAACAVLCWIRPLPASRRASITIIAVAMMLAIVSTAHYGNITIRDWAPAVSILVGYYLSGRFFIAPSAQIERWLMSWDRRLLGDPATRFVGWPRAVLAYLEIVYMGCFLLVPAGFAVLVAAGLSMLADRYWTIVTAAELGAFAPLVLVQTRPPWIVERKPVLADRAVHRAASQMVQRLTIRANTFPSGHVAGSLAVGLALADAIPWVGAVALLLAATIALATIVGRYHYVIDAVAGACLAVTVWTLVTLAGI